jgi:outer membrane protein
MNPIGSRPFTCLMKKLFFGVLVCTLFFSDALVAQTWGLRQCVDYALKNNIQLKQTILSSELANINYTQSKAEFLPSINGSASNSYNFGRSIDYSTNRAVNQQIRSFNFSLNAGVTLFSGFQLLNTLRQSKLEWMASEYEIKKIMNDVSLNVVAAYLQVLYAEESVNSAKDRVTAATQQRNRTKLMVDAGNLAQGGLLDADALLSSEQVAQITAENLLQSATLTLTQLLELDSVGNFKIERPPVDLPDQSILVSTESEIFDMALKTLPEIKSAEYKTQSAEKGLQIAHGGSFPKLTMFGTLGTGYSSLTQHISQFPGIVGVQPIGYTQSGDTVFAPQYGDTQFEDTPFSTQFDDNLGKSVGFSLNVPIFNGLQTHSNIQRAKISVLNARYSQDLVKKQVYKSIQQARLDAVSSLNRYQAAIKNLDAQTLALDYAEKKFNVGLLSSVDIINTRNNKANAESELLQSKYDLIFKIKILEFYAGKPLTL